MNITPIVPYDRALMDIRYKYNSHMVVGFISTKGDGSTDPGDAYLSNF